MKTKKIELFTDGACIGNPGPGGWAFLLKTDNSEFLESSGETLTTNNRMELLAVVKGLTKIGKTNQLIEVFTDSQYIVKAFNEHWLTKWKSNGWRTSQKEDVKNKDLWLELLDKSSGLQIKWTWVKGHAGHPENERVDQEARRVASAFSS